MALTRAAGWCWSGESTIACSWGSRGPNLRGSTDAIFSGGNGPPLQIEIEYTEAMH